MSIMFGWSWDRYLCVTFKFNVNKSDAIPHHIQPKNHLYSEVQKVKVKIANAVRSIAMRKDTSLMRLLWLCHLGLTLKSNEMNLNWIRFDKRLWVCLKTEKGLTKEMT